MIGIKKYVVVNEKNEKDDLSMYYKQNYKQIW